LWCHRSSPPHQRKRMCSGGLRVCGSPAENYLANGTSPLMSGLFVSQKHSTYQSTVCKWHIPLLRLSSDANCLNNFLPKWHNLLSGIHWNTCLQCRDLYSFKHWLSFKDSVGVNIWWQIVSVSVWKELNGKKNKAWESKFRLR